MEPITIQVLNLEDPQPLTPVAVTPTVSTASQTEDSTAVRRHIMQQLRFNREQMAQLRETLAALDRRNTVLLDELDALEEPTFV